jgi:hypothetical protein
VVGATIGSRKAGKKEEAACSVPAFQLLAGASPGLCMVSSVPSRFSTTEPLFTRSNIASNPPLSFTARNAHVSSAEDYVQPTRPPIATWNAGIQYLFVRASSRRTAFSSPNLAELCSSLAARRGVNHCIWSVVTDSTPPRQNLGRRSKKKHQKPAPRLRTGVFARLVYPDVSRLVADRQKRVRAHTPPSGFGSRGWSHRAWPDRRRDLFCPFRGACIFVLIFHSIRLLFSSNIVQFLLPNLETSMGYFRLGLSPSGQSPTQESGHGSIGAASEAAVPPPMVEVARVTRGIATMSGTGCFPTRQSCFVSSGRASACFWA